MPKCDADGRAPTSTYTVLHTDQLGIVRLITDATGDCVSLRAYETFGEFAHEDT